MKASPSKFITLQSRLPDVANVPAPVRRLHLKKRFDPYSSSSRARQNGPCSTKSRVSVLERSRLTRVTETRDGGRPPFRSQRIGRATAGNLSHWPAARSPCDS